MQFIQAANYTPAAERAIDLIVLHDMESPEKGDTAEATARYFANQCKGDKVKGSSAHYNFDNDSEVQSVQEHDVAWAAPGANHNGIHLEHAGYARQSAADWNDDYSQKMLRRSARVAADIAARRSIPIVFRRAADLLAGGERARGFTTHFEVTQAFHKSTHTDPGVGFVIDQYIAFVKEASDPKGAAMARVTDAVDAALIPVWRASDGRPGVWVLKDDGGVFTYPPEASDHFFGSMGGKPLNAPMTGIVAHSPHGYWTIAQDGGIFAFGDAPAMIPFKGFMNEWRIGAHKMVDAEYDGHLLTCLADDGSFYVYKVA